ncbi:MAG: hypothetical protein DRI86_01625 [Bacteroidetes bacterium]|nr:MAG: hypothetical protein DRI86_01625 [Bacteroidota bacterium]
MFKILFSLILIVLTSLSVFAQKVDSFDVNKVRISFEIKNSINGMDYVAYPITKADDTLAIIYNYRNAFIVISAYKQLPPIKAFSLDNSININSRIDNNISFYDLIVDYYSNSVLDNAQNTIYYSNNREKWNVILTNGVKYTKEQYGPLLSSLYGQVNCKDENNHTVNVTNYYTPSNYAVGCVAITFTELLQYYKWPRIGVGSHSYNDSYGSTKGPHSIHFDKEYYNWNDILDEYYKKATSSAQREELGKLAYHAAVSVDMDFEYNGSTSNINRIPAAANKYFRYTAEYITKSASDFWERVRNNIKSDYPVQFAIYTSSGAGHAVVGDGLKVSSGTNFYHLNMGWWGSSNGWYDTENGFNAGGYSNITAAVVDMLPVPEMNTPRLNFEKNTVDIEWFYPMIISPSDYELQVKVGNSDWTEISDDIKTKLYSYSYTSTDLHRFRVRAKNDNIYKDNGWSEYMSIDIEKELNNQRTTEFSIYPTFVSSYINVEYSDFSNRLLTISNITGQIVYKHYFENDSSYSNIQINTEFLKNGMYLLTISGDDGKETKKFIKP